MSPALSYAFYYISVYLESFNMSDRGIVMLAESSQGTGHWCHGGWCPKERQQWNRRRVPQEIMKRDIWLLCESLFLLEHCRSSLALAPFVLFSDDMHFPCILCNLVDRSSTAWPFGWAFCVHNISHLLTKYTDIFILLLGCLYLSYFTLARKILRILA